MNVHRDKIRVFIISSVEGLPVACAIQDAFEHDPFTCTVWTDGVFRIANYTMESLEAAIDDSDFAIAVAMPMTLLHIVARTVTTSYWSWACLWGGSAAPGPFLWSLVTKNLNCLAT
ncbi:UNVERIFIED_ORG: hypothetical protein GGE44_001093 [Rhizobium esperanzae]